MTSATTTGRPVSARLPSNRRLPLSHGRRRATLVVHIMAAGAWIGIDVIVAVLVLTGRFSDDVAVKLTLNLVLCTLIVLVLRPGMDEVAGYGRDLLTGTPDPETVSSLLFPPAVSLTTLTLATVLASSNRGAGSGRDERSSAASGTRR
jgi:hypothetical protein